MEWSEAILTMFLTVCTLIVLFLMILVLGVNKVMRFILSPITSRSKRK